MNELYFYFVWRQLLDYPGIDAVYVCCVIFLVFEQAITHDDLSSAVDKMRGVGRDAYNAATVRGRSDLDLIQLNVSASLGDDTHSATMVDVNASDFSINTVRNGYSGTKPVGCPEDKHIANRGFEFRPHQSDASFADFLCRDVLPCPIVLRLVRGFPFLGIKFQPAPKWIYNFIAVDENQGAIFYPVREF